MTSNMQTALHHISTHATIGLSGILPFTLGSGRDSHDNPVPDAEAVVRRGLMALVEAGRLASAALEGSDAMASLPDAAAGDSE